MQHYRHLLLKLKVQYFIRHKGITLEFTLNLLSAYANFRCFRIKSANEYEILKLLMQLYNLLASLRPLTRKTHLYLNLLFGEH